MFSALIVQSFLTVYTIFSVRFVIQKNNQLGTKTVQISGKSTRNVLSFDAKAGVKILEPPCMTTYQYF